MFVLCVFHCSCSLGEEEWPLIVGLFRVFCFQLCHVVPFAEFCMFWSSLRRGNNKTEIFYLLKHDIALSISSEFSSTITKLIQSRLRQTTPALEETPPKAPEANCSQHAKLKRALSDRKPTNCVNFPLSFSLSNSVPLCARFCLSHRTPIEFPMQQTAQ